MVPGPNPSPESQRASPNSPRASPDAPRASPDSQGPPPVGPRPAEELRLEEDAQRIRNWKRWGPYLSERQWGTVREDYSPDGAAWDYFPHSHARSRAYRWGEDGLLGICDRQARLCFALALWNHRDPILKERLFGLTGPQGNHGEDVKELYYYLESTPTHSYLKGLYKYPQAEYPYRKLIEVNRGRGRHEPEYEILDTGVFEAERYFDVFVEYAKADTDPDDVLIRITVVNRGPEAASLDVLPQLWFRNNWSWGGEDEESGPKPRLFAPDRAPGRTPRSPAAGPTAGADIEGLHHALGTFHLRAGPGPDGRAPELLFTENETNNERLFQCASPSPYVKDAFHEAVVHGRTEAVNPRLEGTKAALRYSLRLAAGATAELRLRLRLRRGIVAAELGADFERTFQSRARELDLYYLARLPQSFSDDERLVVRQAYAGLAWSKQFYHYVQERWIDGDPLQPPPPATRKAGRNADWGHIYNRDVISMPDAWEYPWYAAWDLAFHMIPFARLDAEFAKSQLELFLREWYMHPNGQIPAYEWSFSDVNPPVHAWAVWRVYKKTGRDRRFLASCFQKLLLNFTWWVNRKDAEGRHVFSGGFLGMDNISVFDRSQPLPTGGFLDQADGTAWMAFYCGTMLQMAVELALHDPTYEDMASKFLEHYVHIADAMNHLGGSGLWSVEDGFYYDQIRLPEGNQVLRVRSMVGLVPLIAVEVLDGATIDRLPAFKKRLQWFLRHRKDLAGTLGFVERNELQEHDLRLFSIPSRERLERILRYVFDENEFLSPHGLRSVSRVHADKPFSIRVDGVEHRLDYAPGESLSSLFGGNSNWRGPVWFPINFLIVEALERYGRFYGESLKIECPVGSGNFVSLQLAADELARRLTRPFLRGEDGSRPVHGGDSRYRDLPAWRDLVLFYEYFHGETGQGLGASHQTGWTALVATLMESLGRGRERAAALPRHVGNMPRSWR
ncbi:MAG: glucosidase [Planctomycetes bacterium]|nr:glucosidase [Planctomycetota bacterium]